MARPPAVVLFVIGRTNVGWHVRRVDVREPGKKVLRGHRGIEWRRNSSLDAVAAAIALLRLKQEDDADPVLDSEVSDLEHELVSSCGSALRNVGDGSTKWMRTVFGDWPVPRASGRNPLRDLIEVSRRAPATLRLATGRSLVEFGFAVGLRPARSEELLAFVEHVSGKPFRPVTSEDENPLSLRIVALDTQQRQLARDNHADRLQLAILGSRRPHAPQHDRLIHEVVAALAPIIARGDWHVVVGPRGIGLEVLERAYRVQDRLALTYTLLLDSWIAQYRKAPVTLLIGGGQSAIRDARALADGSLLIPLIATGGAAEDIVRVAPKGFRYLTSEDRAALGNPDPDVMAHAVADLLTRFRPELEEARRRARLQAAYYEAVRKRVRD